MDIEKRLSALGLTLPAPPTPAGNYVGSVRVDNLLFVGGNVGRLNAEPLEYTGKVGGEVTLEQAYEMARRCALNHLAAIKAALGDLDRVERSRESHRLRECRAGFQRDAEGDQWRVRICWSSSGASRVATLGRPWGWRRSAVTPRSRSR